MSEKTDDDRYWSPEPTTGDSPSEQPEAWLETLWRLSQNKVRCIAVVGAGASTPVLDRGDDLASGLIQKFNIEQAAVEAERERLKRITAVDPSEFEAQLSAIGQSLGNSRRVQAAISAILELTLAMARGRGLVSVASLAIDRGGLYYDAYRRCAGQSAHSWKDLYTLVGFKQDPKVPDVFFAIEEIRESGYSGKSPAEGELFGQFLLDEDSQPRADRQELPRLDMPRLVERVLPHIVDSPNDKEIELFTEELEELYAGTEYEIRSRDDRVCAKTFSSPVAEFPGIRIRYQQPWHHNRHMVITREEGQPKGGLYFARHHRTPYVTPVTVRTRRDIELLQSTFNNRWDNSVALTASAEGKP